jgi:hypothetical protein
MTPLHFNYAQACHLISIKYIEITESNEDVFLGSLP